MIESRSVIAGGTGGLAAGKEWEERITKGLEETFGGNGYVPY